MNKSSILIVEDDMSIQNLYKMKFSLAGHLVETAGNGIEGLQKSEDISPDLILLDLKMPEMNGEEMLLKLRESAWGKTIPVIVLTNISKDEAPLELRSLGVSDYLVKALYTPAQVVERAEAVLARQK